MTRKRTKVRQTRNRKPRRDKPYTVDGAPMNPELKRLFQEAEREPAPVTVNRVTLDNTVPGGFRLDAVPVTPGQRI